MAKISLKDIAREVGVSIASVSIVLNNKNQNNRVSKETAQRIIDKAEELNYMPNTIGKALKMGRSKTLGLIVADISNVFFGTLALHVQEYAEKKGYTVIVANTNEEITKMEKMIRLLKSRQVDGLIITAAENSETLIENLVQEKMPLTLVDRNFPDIKLNSVLINNYQISYQATQKLMEQNCSKIACIAYKQNHFHIHERVRGFSDALKNSKDVIPIIKEVRYSHLIEDMEKCISELMCEKKMIDGIFFATNTISVYGLRELSKYHIDFQRHVKLFCFDESDLFYILPYKVPFIKQPIKEIAEKAVELVVNEIESKNSDKRHFVIDAEMII